MKTIPFYLPPIGFGIIEALPTVNNTAVTIKNKKIEGGIFTSSENK